MALSMKFDRFSQATWINDQLNVNTTQVGGKVDTWVQSAIVKQSGLRIHSTISSKRVAKRHCNF